MREKPNDQLILLAQMAAENKHFSPRDLINSYLPLLLIVIVGLALTIGGIIATQNWEEQIQSTYLSGAKRIYIGSVEDQLEGIRHRARMIQALYLASDKVEASEFHSFSQSLLDQEDDGTFVILAQLKSRELATDSIWLSLAAAPFEAHTPDLSPSMVKQILFSPIVATELKKVSPKSPARSHQIKLSETDSDLFLIYMLLMPQISQQEPFFIVSGMRKSKVFDYSKLDLTAAEIQYFDSEVSAANSNPLAHQTDINGFINIRFENIGFDLEIKESHTILQKSRLFKWALTVFSILFTCLLCAQFIYAKQSVHKLALLAVQRTSDLTSINSELTDEIMNRIKFQAELIDRNAEIGEANKKLAEAQNQLIQQEKMASLGQLAAGVAHEINNPIGFINSNLTMLEKYADRIFKIFTLFDTVEGTLTNPSLKEEIAKTKQEARYNNLKSNMVSVIEESKEGVDRVKRIVQDLKDFSRVDEAEWQWANLHDGINSTLNIAWNEIKYKATVHKEYGDIPLVECVPFQINQVVMNLLVNAAQAIKDSGEIFIRTWQTDGDVVIEIEDTGTGIPANIISKIFDPFFTTKEIGKGTGLGLSLSYGIIIKHGGDLKVQSVVGKGTTFTITLPIQQENPRSVA